MEDYKPNSNKYKEEQKLVERDKKVEKVVTGKVITKKKSGLSKLTNEFISEDAHSVGSYIIKDVVIPAAKKLIYDIFTDGIDISFSIIGGHITSPNSCRLPRVS